MTRLPAISARQLLKALLKAGFLERQQRGSHLRLYHPGKNLQTTIPMHPGDMQRGFVKIILKQTGLSEAELRKFL